MAEPEAATTDLPRGDGKEEDDQLDAQSDEPVIKTYDIDQNGGRDEMRENGFEDDGAAASLEPNEKEQLVVEEEDGDREHLGPRDEIKVTVTGYQRTADNCTFDVEVC